MAEHRVDVEDRLGEQTRWIVDSVTAVVTIVVGTATSIIVAALG